MTDKGHQPIRQLADAGRDIWPRTSWKQVLRRTVPVVHLDVETGAGRRWRIFDSTYENLNDDQIAYLRSVIVKTIRMDVICLVISQKGTETEEALHENVYAVHPGFVAARLTLPNSSTLEVLDAPDSVLVSMSAQDLFRNIENGNFQFDGYRAYLGSRCIEFVSHYCRKCKRDLFCATGMILSQGDAARDVAEYGRDVAHFGIDECTAYLNDAALEKLAQHKGFSGIPVAPLVWVERKGEKAGSFQSQCPACKTMQKNGALAFNIRLDKLDDPRTDHARTFQYLPITEESFMWDYSLVESRKFDPDLFDDIGYPQPGWTLIGQ